MKLPDTIFDPERLAALESYGVLDTLPEAGFDDIAQLAAQICETPVALVSFVTSTRQWFKARVGFEPCQTDLESSVCAFSLVEPDMLTIGDLASDPRTRDNPLVAGPPHIRFYAGVPLRTASGAALGTLCVIDGTPRPDGLTQTQASGLRGLGRQVMSQLELRRALVDRDQAMKLQQMHQILRQESEEQYRALFKAIDDGFCIIELKFEDGRAVDYRFVEVNGAFARHTGLADAEGQWMRALAPDHEQYWFDTYGAVARTGEAVRFEHYAGQLGERWYGVHAFRVGPEAAQRVGVIFSDITDRKKAEDAQRVLNEEISHRMKNSFAMVQAIATQTLRPVADQGPVEAFVQRVHALSSAHDVLMQQSWAAADLATVIAAALGPLMHDARFSASGPPVELGPRATLSVSLLLHELATNALKYGALSTEHGRIRIAWTVDAAEGEDRLALAWREEGGPSLAAAPTRKGFGSRLIQRGLVGTGGVDLRYETTGLEADFSASLARLRSS